MIKISNLKFGLGDCQELILGIPDKSVDVILTDPPYLYLKNQKLEREFDEHALFVQWRRVLKKGGFVVMFGRGASFYRWNARLAELGFEFKEEIVWDKRMTSSPLLPLSRVHETISIHTIGGGKINRVKVPYLEMKAHDLPSIMQDIKRMRGVLNNTKSFNAVLNYLETGQPGVFSSGKAGVTISSDINRGEVCTDIARRLNEGMNEKSIMQQGRDHYTAKHPTQKPVRLLERLLSLVSQPGDVVLDCFAGSFSTAEACYNTGRAGWFFEIDADWFDTGVHRIEMLDLL